MALKRLDLDVCDCLYFADSATNTSKAHYDSGEIVWVFCARSSSHHHLPVSISLRL